MSLTLLYMSVHLITSFLITLLLLPKIIKVVHFKRLMDEPTERSSHVQKIPSLGGIAFYISIVLGLYFLHDEKNIHEIMSLIPGLLILFIVGLKDDLVVLSPFTKLMAQVISISFVLVEPTFQVQHLYGFLGFDNVPMYVLLPITGFVMLAVINSFNLIDGIDGLASIVGIIIFSILGSLFYMLHMYLYLGISLVLVGSLLAFLRFNISKDKKIFMGDTGSLVLGFMIAVLVIRLFATPQADLRSLPFMLENLPLVILSVLVVPFFDTTRVFTVRLIKKQNPFSPDRNHVHHILIDYFKFSHIKASLVIGIINLLFTTVFLILSSVLSSLSIIFLMIVIFLTVAYSLYRLNIMVKKMRKSVFS